MSQFGHEREIWIFTDGAASGNPGPGGWGVVFWDQRTGRIRELGGAVSLATNNQMEMEAAIQGLEEALKTKLQSLARVVVLTDSRYLIDGITAWSRNWIRSGWKTKDGQEVRNQDQWKELLEKEKKLKKSVPVQWKKVSGHRGIPGNARADEIAVGFSKGKEVSLFSGLLSDYSLNIHELLQVQTRGSGKPYYISMVENKLQRHSTWAECEARVRGKRGAKFKKIQDPSEERALLESWGHAMHD